MISAKNKITLKPPFEKFLDTLIKWMNGDIHMNKNLVNFSLEFLYCLKRMIIY